MIKIDKRQRQYLLDNGVHPKNIHHTHGHYKSYYATYNYVVAELLDRLASDSKVSTKTNA